MRPSGSTLLGAVIFDSADAALLLFVQFAYHYWPKINRPYSFSLRLQSHIVPNKRFTDITADSAPADFTVASDPTLGPSPLVLRSSRFQFYHRALDGFLEGSVLEKVSGRRKISERWISSSVARRRKLFAKVAIREGEPSARGVGGNSRRMALFRTGSRNSLVTASQRNSTAARPYQKIGKAGAAAPPHLSIGNEVANEAGIRLGAMEMRTPFHSALNARNELWGGAQRRPTGEK
jgi:hypothetical protein